MRHFILLMLAIMSITTSVYSQKAPIAKYDCITLGNDDGYFDMNSTMGEKVMNLKDFTFSVWYRVEETNKLDGNGHFIFACSALAENSADAGPYVACRLNQQRFEISTGGWNHEEFIMQGQKAKPGVWTHLLYRQQGHHGELYLNGSLVGSNDKMPYLSDIFKEAPRHNWIGKAPFKGDKYLSDTDIRDLSLFDFAVSDSELKKLSNKKHK